MRPLRSLFRLTALLYLALSLAGCEQPTDTTLQPLEDKAGTQPGLSLIVHPYDNPSRLVERFQPLCEHLSGALGIPVRLEIARSYVDQMRRITRGQADLTYIGPTPFLRAQTSYLGEHDPKLIALAAEEVGGETAYRSVIVTRADSSIQEPADLAGKLMAFGAPHSYSSHYVPRVMLLKAGVDLGTLKDYAFLDRHERVALAVLHGDFDAGGLRYGIAAQYLDRSPGLRIIATSPPLPPHLIVARAGLDEGIRARVQHALFTFTQRSNDGTREVHYRAPDPGSDEQVRQVVAIVEHQTPPQEWPW